ncbi:hypothetical protein HYC85_005076 [Camellia sinensis]|uniref:Uncharacterized protein n=1 Tax=Camellia sinensis TaxID=4442 RepID=A0A7J7I009_CAMSI|nr:hypothetical protein HYC85_005076 [Camellia sinensis]
MAAWVQRACRSAPAKPTVLLAIQLSTDPVTGFGQLLTHNKHQCPTQIYDMMITGMDSSIEASLSARERNIGGSKERRETIVAKEIRRAKAFGTVILIAGLESQLCIWIKPSSSEPICQIASTKIDSSSSSWVVVAGLFHKQRTCKRRRAMYTARKKPP